MMVSWVVHICSIEADFLTCHDWTGPKLVLPQLKAPSERGKPLVIITFMKNTIQLIYYQSVSVWKQDFFLLFSICVKRHLTKQAL